MAKPVIKTTEELYQKLIDEVMVVDAADKEQDFIEMVSARYERNANIYNSRMTDFTSEDKVGMNDNMFVALNQFRRVDDMAENVNFNPALAAMMMGMSNAGAAHYKDASAKQLFPVLEPSISQLEEKYEIPAAVKREFKVQADEVAHTMSMLETDTTELPLEQYPIAERINVVCCGLKTFYDSTAFIGENNRPLPITRAVKQLFAEASTKGAQLLKAAMGTGDYQPINQQEEKQIATLRRMTEGFTERMKQAATEQIYQYALPKSLIYEPLSVEPSRISLKLEKNVILRDMTVESFTEKCGLGNLSRPEKEWGEATVDRMLDQMYSANEMKQLKSAGVEPATEIYVDGKPALDLTTGRMVEMDGHEMPETFRMRFAAAQPRLEDYAELKCAITAASLEGKAVDVTKLRVNPEGEVHRSDTTISVNVQNDMKREPVSLWHRFLRFLGLEKAAEDKSLESNNPEKHNRNYDTIRQKIDLNELMGTVPRRTTAAAEHQNSPEKSVQK